MPQKKGWMGFESISKINEKNDYPNFFHRDLRKLMFLWIYLIEGYKAFFIKFNSAHVKYRDQAFKSSDP